MPTPIHESLQHCLTNAITEAQSDLSDPTQCLCVTGEEMAGFGGQYEGSTKIADLAVKIANADDEYETKMVFEIGFSEGYEDLIKDAKMWLEGMSSVSLCVLIGIEEEPRYQCPVDDNMDEEEFKRLGFPHPRELKPKHFRLKGLFGPAIYKGLDNEELGDAEPDNQELGDAEPDNEELGDAEPDNEELGDAEPDNEELGDEEPDNELEWVGKISTAFLERWRRDARTGRAKKSGNRVVSYILLMRISLTNWYVVGTSYRSQCQAQTERFYGHHTRR
jgi:hypothetical protein